MLKGDNQWRTEPGRVLSYSNRFTFQDKLGWYVQVMDEENMQVGIIMRTKNEAQAIEFQQHLSLYYNIKIAMPGGVFKTYRDYDIK